jgi:hypothetical protein
MDAQDVIEAAALTHEPNTCACDCGPEGACVNGACVCSATHTGPSCRQRKCRSDECAGTDSCYANGTDSSQSECSGQGRCSDGQCSCSNGFDSLTNCATSGCPGDGTCSGRGACVNGSCACSPGFFGVDCALSDCADGLRPGVVVEYFSANTGGSPTLDAEYRTRQHLDVVPGLTQFWGYDTIVDFPQSGSSTYIITAVYTGFMRPRETMAGTRLQWSFSGAFCRVFLNGTLVSTSSLFTFVAGSMHSIRVEYQVGAAYSPIRH